MPKPPAALSKTVRKRISDVGRSVYAAYAMLHVATNNKEDNALLAQIDGQTRKQTFSEYLQTLPTDGGRCISTVTIDRITYQITLTPTEDPTRVRVNKIGRAS